MTGLELALIWGGVAVLGGLLALDETSLAQTWFSQPLPAALLAGLVVGDPAAALVPGFFMQLVVLGNLPVGSASTLDATSATIGVTAGVLIAGWQPAAPTPLAVWTAPTGAEVGLQLIAMALLSLAGGRLIRLERRTHLAWKLAVYRQLRDGDFTVVDRLHRRSLGVAMGRGAAVTLLMAALVAMSWNLIVRAISPVWQAALALVPAVAVLLAAATVSERFGHRRAWPLLTGATVLGALSGRWLW